MSDRPLPADMADWPASPHELLGVGHRYGMKELKKAYTKLIRVYKPELHPQEFARIRDAYDRLLPWAVAEAKEAPAPEAEELAPPQPAEETLPFPGTLVRLTLDGRSPPRQDRYPAHADDGDRFWREAADGNPEPAYRGLAEDAVRRPAVERTYLRLFWLLSVYRELDAERHPADWLARGMSACPGSQKIVETYATHLSLQPLEANSPRCAAVVNGLSDPYQISFVLQHVWKHLLRARRWADLRDQWPAAKGRLTLTTDAWLGLVRTVADHAAWEPTNLTAIDLMKDCARELDELSYVALQKPEVFDRFDYLKTLAKSHAAVRGTPGLDQLASLVRAEWTADLDAIRGDLHRLVGDMAMFPNKWSNYFGGAGPSAFIIASRCHQLVTQLQYETGFDPPLPTDPDFVIRVGSELTPRPFGRYRDAIYRFCLETCVSPEALAADLAPRYSKKFPHSTSLEEMILGDWPLRLVCLAHRFYHS